MHHGRSTDSIKIFSKELGINNYLISGNGAILYDIKEEKIIYNKFLTKDQVLKIAKICEENSIHYSVYTEEEVISKDLKYNVLYYYRENMNKPEEKRTNINIVSNVFKYIEKSENENFLKITICDDNIEIFNNVMKKIKNIDNFDLLDVDYMTRKKIKCGEEEILVEYYYTEITNENVNKWTALKFLLDKLNIKKDEVIAIGDNYNDRQMIENAGLGIVMGNSNPFMKICADIIVTDNNSDGVCEAIEKYILS